MEREAIDDSPAPAVPGPDAWTVHHSRGPAGPFHQRTPSEPVRAEAWVHTVARPALVLGSTQPEHLVDRERAASLGVDVVRRRSGGGLVYLEPGNDCWIDLLLPRTSQLWRDDVSRAFDWVGDLWAGALSSLLDPVDTAAIGVHRGPPLHREAGRILCYAGLGAGELSIGGHKVVGLSLRRWRQGARFQCAMTWRWRPEVPGACLEPAALAAVERARGVALDHLPIGLPAPARGPVIDDVVAAVLAGLPPP